MALVKCPKCGTLVSDKGTTCPVCGAAVSEILAKLNGTDVSQESPVAPPVPASAPPTPPPPPDPAQDLRPSGSGSRTKPWMFFLIFWGAMLVVGGIILALVVLLKNPSAPETPQPEPCPLSGFVGSFEWVDLGLSVKWATCNLGAAKPEECGDYYMWNWADGACQERMGRPWRMPTRDEFQELISCCDYMQTSLNGVPGVQFRSRTNGQAIFLPFAGHQKDMILDGVYKYGDYWSSTPDARSSQKSWRLTIGSTTVRVYHAGWYYGCSIRPVCDVVN